VTIATAEEVFGFTMVMGNNACEIVLGANAKEIDTEAR